MDLICCVLCLLAVFLVALPVTMRSCLDLLFECPESFASRVGQISVLRVNLLVMQLISVFERVWTVCCKSANGRNRTLEGKKYTDEICSCSELQNGWSL